MGTSGVGGGIAGEAISLRAALAGGKIQGWWFAVRVRCVENRSMATKKEAVVTVGAPAAIGPYTQAVRVGDVVYTSGQIPLDPRTMTLVAGGITEQTTQVFENLKAVLEAAGTSLGAVVKTLVFLTDLNDFAAMNEVYARYVAGEGVVAPARSTVQVAALPRGALVEIEVVAL